MKLKTLTLPALLALGTLLAPRAAEAQAGYRVVVNADGPVSSASRDDLSRIFLKKSSTWPGGAPALPVDLGENSAVRKAFTRDVLGKDLNAVITYWQQMIFSGRGTPPPQKSSDAEVLSYVRNTTGAVGYVSTSGDLSPGVRALSVTN